MWECAHVSLCVCMPPYPALPITIQCYWWFSVIFTCWSSLPLKWNIVPSIIIMFYQCQKSLRICRLFLMTVQSIRSWTVFYTLQLRELEDKYAECMEMLHEAQEELKNLRNKTMPNTVSRRYHSLGLFPMVSTPKKKTWHSSSHLQYTF